MKSAQIVNQVFKKNRTLSSAYPKQKKAVLFAFFVLFVIPVLGVCLTGEISRSMMGNKSRLYFPDVSKYTVVFETSYGELCVNMEVAVACMLPVIVPKNFEEEVMKAQAILLRTELLRCYEVQKDKTAYKIYLEKTPFEKMYFTFLEQKELYGEDYISSLAVYRKAALETAGMYLRDVDESDLSEAGKIAHAGWFLLSSGSTREGILCEKDYKSENYYNEKIITQREFQKVMEALYLEHLAGKVNAEQTTEQTTEQAAAQEKKQAEVEEIHFQGIDKTINFSVLLKDGTYDMFSALPEKICDAFGLLSPFVEDITETDNQVSFVVKGVGHGSGMSVFGANELAKEGRNYSEILNYFFTNIAIDKFE